MTAGLLERVTERTTSQVPSEAAHIVKQTSDKSAQHLVVEALVEGTPLEALCGHVFVPSKDPKALPICEACKDVADGKTNGRWEEIE